MAARRWRWAETSISCATGPMPTGLKRAIRSRRRTKRIAPRAGEDRYPNNTLAPKNGGSNMDLKFSKVARKGPVTIVTLSRPEVYNALHIEAHFELNKVFDDFA